MKKIIVFAGPSGVGKSTLCHMALRYFPDTFSFAVSATTRSPRLQEMHGKDYFFLSQEQFKEKIENEEFIEWEEVYPERFYGTLCSEYDRIVSEGKKMLLDIDVVGALNIKEKFGDDALIIFIKPESLEELERRLYERKSESQEDIKNRVERFRKELSYEDSFDASILNATGKLESSQQQLFDIFNKELPEIGEPHLG
jgi:guanylate kinase